MQFNLEAHSARLELRVMELEDTTRAISGILKTMTAMIGSMNEMMNHYADSLGGLMMGLPSVVTKLPLFPIQEKSCRPNTSTLHCCG